MESPTKYQVIQKEQILALQRCADHRKSCKVCTNTYTCQYMVLLNTKAVEMMLTQA